MAEPAKALRWLSTRFFTALILAVPSLALALEPAEVGVIANKFVSGSVDLARYYMEQRGIPKGNLVRIDTTNKETVSREGYDKEIAGPVRNFLRSWQGQGEIRCLVTVFGVPLKVGAPELTRAHKKAVEAWRKELVSARAELKKIPEPRGEATKMLQQLVATLDARIKAMDIRDQGAAVDSELSLVLVDVYPLDGSVPNPYFTGFQQKKLSVAKDEVLMVARLDGPTAEIVKRMIDGYYALAEAYFLSLPYLSWQMRWSGKVQGYACSDS